MITKFRNMLRKWLGITSLATEAEYLKNNFLSQDDRITQRLAELDKLTALDADIGMRGKCTIVLSGVYRGKGYVTFYDMDHRNFEEMVEQFKYMRRQHIVRNIDTPPYIKGSFFLKD